MKLLTKSLLLLLPFGVSAQKEQNFEVTVILDSFSKFDRISLEYYNPFKSLDELIILTDSFNTKGTFTGTISEPYPATLTISNKTNSHSFDASALKFSFFLMPGKTEIHSTRSFSKTILKGAEDIQLYRVLRRKEMELENQLLSIVTTQFIKTGLLSDSKKLDSVKKEIARLDLSYKKELLGSYINSNSQSDIALYALRQLVPAEIDSPSYYLGLYDQLSFRTKQWPSAIELYKRLLTSENIRLGRTGPDFRQFDRYGNIVTLSSFRGKTVLLDFWANWCIPCRKLAPELKLMYDKYTAHNFTIIGIALERKEDKEKWLQAIKKDELTWPQVTDFKFTQNEVAIKYGISEIPFNILLDASGKIMGINLSISEIDAMLSTTLLHK